MDLPFSLPLTDQIIQIILILLILIVLWGIIKALLRLTIKVFSCGCSLIFLLGLVLLIFSAVSNSG